MDCVGDIIATSAALLAVAYGLFFRSHGKRLQQAALVLVLGGGIGNLKMYIRDSLNNKRTVVLNMESTNKEVSRRLVDFLSGVAYANNGQIKRVANSTFIITPYNVDIMGDLLDELENNGAFY